VFHQKLARRKYGPAPTVNLQHDLPATPSLVHATPRPPLASSIQEFRTVAASDEVNQTVKLNDDELQAVLASAREVPAADRRVDQRFPFFSPVTLRPAAAIDRPQTAYARELSQGGIGLLHYVPFEPGQVFQITVLNEDFNWRKRCEVAWCKPAGDGWYVSGCRFI